MNGSEDNALFGTDGIRGRRGSYPFDDASLLKLGRAIAQVLSGSRVLIGRDTRQSGPEIIEQLAAGIGRDAELYLAGVIPTPGLSYLIRSGGFDFGIMISASHNPFLDNGIKILDRHGEKIPNETEKQIEARFSAIPAMVSRSFFLHPPPAAADASVYDDFLIRCGADLQTLPAKIVIDCAQGAAAAVAPRVFSRLGLTVVSMGDHPDGTNINAGCGSTTPAAIVREVAASQADIGFAFDGDADRVIWVDRQGNVLDGDHTLFTLARFFAASEPSFPRIVVGTILTNLGLERSLQRLGIDCERTAVGDRHVWQAMQRRGAMLGGEPSGHTILRNWQPTGDGILTALMILRALGHSGMEASDIRRALPLFPQKTIDLRIRGKKPLAEWEALNRLINDFDRRHGRHSRLVIRYSGTEAKIRLLFEAEDQAIIDANLQPFVDLIASEIGE